MIVGVGREREMNVLGELKEVLIMREEGQELVKALKIESDWVEWMRSRMP